MPAGRPPKYSAAMRDRICFFLAEGMSIRQICEQPKTPDKAQVFRWLAKYEEFRDQYAKAKRQGIEALAEEIIDIADDGTNDYMENEDRDGHLAYKVNGEAVARSRLRIDARKWILAKLIPKKYGEKIEVDQIGETQPLNISFRVAEPKSELQITKGN